jgi:acetylornithine deacetylase/succinyl-diaminopimelate desuccinylase-like protein
VSLDVFAHVDRHRDEFVERLADWVRQPSVSATGQGMPAAAGHARRLVAGAGLDARVAETPGWPLVLGHRDELAADLVVWSDGPVDPGGGWRLVFGVRGVASFELRAAGANRPLHSGNWGGVVPNPLWTLVQLLASMKDRQGRVTVDGFYDEVGRWAPPRPRRCGGCRSTSRPSRPTSAWTSWTRRPTAASSSASPPKEVRASPTSDLIAFRDPVVLVMRGPL